MFESREIELKGSVKEGLGDYQKYIPIYQQFIDDNTSLADKTLNYNVKLKSIEKKEDSSYNEFVGITENNEKISIFTKFCPLFDPIKVLLGKKTYDEFSLPKLGDENHVFSDKNNTAFVDSFFSYLTSRMYHDDGFKHGLDCYGSFMAMKKEFRVDIADDIEYLFNSDYFMKHKDEFNISDNLYDQFQPGQSCKYKKKLEINNTDSVDIEVDELDVPILTLNEESLQALNNDDALIYNKTPSSSIKSSQHSGSGSTCSSRTSITSDDDGSECDSVFSEDEELISAATSAATSRSGSIYSCEEEDEPIYASLKVLPTNMVFLEACEDTLDDYIMNNDVGESEWSSILMQIVMSLVVFQEKFLFIHNDLHSSNVMYVKTDKEYLYYRYNERYYKVPTYGKIWKIIDFGRAIYKFRGKVIFSDSFSEHGDASTQYNCEPYLNPDKQIVPPNFSFDLCRLACSLYDFFEEEEDHLPKIRALIEEWLLDDKDRNILYKKNGDERYEDFKLYKMISRSVHRHVPKDQLERKIFTQYLVPRKNIKKKMDMVMKIDEIPCYTD